MTENLIFENVYLEEVYRIPAKTAIILARPWNELTEDHRQLLSKILQAVKLSLNSVRIVHQSNFDLSSWSEKPQRAIAFFLPPKGLTPYEVIQTGATSMIFSDPLEILSTDDASKRKLWSTLKALFQA